VKKPRQRTSRTSAVIHSKPYNISTARLTSSQAILAGDASNNDKMEFVNERQNRTHRCLDPHATTEPLDRPNSPSFALLQDHGGRSVHGGEHDGIAAANVDPPNVTHITMLPSEQAQSQSGSEEQEWEIIRILGKRRTRKGQEYKVRWEDTWLRRSELGNTQELLRKFEGKGRAQRECKRGRSARADKGR